MTSWNSGYVADLGYTHGFYRELTPRLLQLAALARGVAAPDTETPLTYCELGCGQGVTVNVLAAANPHIAFYANDFNPAHIAGARRLATEAGTPNLHLLEHSFAEMLDDDALPMFDIVCLHGIYSWIGAEHRATIVEFLRRRLKPGGLAYVSYNALPGWASAAPMRHLMYLHGQAMGGPTASRLDPALTFMDRMIESKGLFFRANPGLRQRFDKLRTQDRHYLAHEYLNDAWQLFYFSDVAGDMAEAKLVYAGSANLLDHVDVLHLSAEQQQSLAGIADPVLRETSRDFLVNTQFRRDVFVKGQVALPGTQAHEHWLETRLVLGRAAGEVPMKIQGSLGEASLQPETYQPLLTSLDGAPIRLRELARKPEVAGIGWPRLFQALHILIGAGHVDVCLDAAGEAARHERTRAFNDAVLRRALYSADIKALASPVTGGGVNVDRFQQLFLLARQQGKDDAVGLAWRTLKTANQRLLRDGKPIEDEAGNLEELGRRHEEFVAKRLPVLERLGVV